MPTSLLVKNPTRIDNHRQCFTKEEEKKETEGAAEPITVVKTERRQNFTAKEVQVIMQETGKNTTVIKGIYTPKITSKAKEKVWISLTKPVNSINGKGDREWQDVRKKWIDTSCSARTKLRIIDRKQRKTGVAQALHPSQQGRKPCYRRYTGIAGTMVLGFPGEIDTAAVSRSGRSLATSGGLISYSNLLLNDLSNESEIYFDLNSFNILCYYTWNIILLSDFIIVTATK